MPWKNRHEHKSFDFFKQQLQPYYMYNPKYDESGRVIRSISPTTVLHQFNPLPNKDVAKKINYYFMPYENRVVHAQRYMRFDQTDHVS